MSETTDDFLQHHGVVGMKWGKHKAGSGGSGGSGSKAETKVAKKAIRKEIFNDAKASVKAHKGRTAAGVLLAGPSVTVGIQLARSAGHSKGASVAIGMLSGAPGGVLAVHLAARKAVKNGDG
jgi:hypothetical protein